MQNQLIADFVGRGNDDIGAESFIRRVIVESLIKKT
jgi:hypothetical protein